ncbi:MAG TPA: SCO family protein [Miltoncostaeaceae bacterium]|nr:SCO family protein [Miltoncostaeaceae bacterium]
MTDTHTPPPSGRTRLPLFVGGAIALAAIAAIAILLIARGGDDRTDLRAPFTGPVIDAPATTGTNYDGRRISLPRAGKPGLVTFLYTECPDICPAITATIRQALEDAGPGGKDIDVTAISVDPKGDTPASVTRFLTKFGMRGRMNYLVGTRAQLEPIWKSWMIAGQPDDQNVSAHSATIVLVDRDGRQVGRYPAGIQVPIADLAADIATLTAQK